MDMTEQTRAIIARNIQALMDDAGTKADALAKRIGVGYSSLYRILRKEQTATSEMLEKVGHGLGVPGWVLLLKDPVTLKDAKALGELVSRFQELTDANKSLAANMLAALSGDNTLAAPKPSDKARNTAA